ncbi:MAG: response regulator, partial [Phycisphaerales bacterium]
FHLKRAGAQVDIAPNGRIALEMFNASKAAPEHYDLLLTDIQMPEMDGIELTTHLRAAGETIPIIAVTAHAMSEDRDRCLSAGCNDYATKPIDPANLIATCHAWLGKTSSTPNKRNNRPNKAA